MEYEHTGLHFSTIDKKNENHTIFHVTSKIPNLPKWPTYVMSIEEQQMCSTTDDYAEPESCL